MAADWEAADWEAADLAQLLERVAADVPQLSDGALGRWRLELRYAPGCCPCVALDAVLLAIDDEIARRRGIEPDLIPGSLLGDLSDLPERRPGGLF